MLHFDTQKKMSKFNISGFFKNKKAESYDKLKLQCKAIEIEMNKEGEMYDKKENATNNDYEKYCEQNNIKGTRIIQ